MTTKEANKIRLLWKCINAVFIESWRLAQWRRPGHVTAAELDKEHRKIFALFSKILSDEREKLEP